MAISNWLNADKWGILRDKFNAIVTLLKGGTAGQKLVSTGVGDPQWVNDTTALPDQTGHVDEYLQTDGTTASWVPIVIPTSKDIFLLGRSGDINANYPNSGTGGQGPSQIGLSITLPNDGINRDCLLGFTIDVDTIGFTPSDLIGFYKNGILLKEYAFVIRVAEMLSGSYLAANCAPNDVFTLRIRVTGSSNQILIKTYSFTCLGNPL